MPAFDTWAARGRPIRDAALRDRIASVLERAAARVPALARDAPPPTRDVDEALTRLDAVSDLLLAEVASDPGLVDLVVELRDLHGDLREHRTAQRLAAVTGLQKALARLHGTTSVATLLERAPEAIVTHLGFDRAIISRVEDHRWIPVKIYVRDDPGWADQILGAASESQPLDSMILETEMVRRRAPMLVRDVQEREDVHMPIASTSDSRSYVAAPIMPEGSVIGFLHADHYLSQRHPDELDRDVLFAFAEAFGYVVERTAMVGRMRAQGDQVRAMAASLEAVIDELRDSEVRLEAETPGAPATGARRAAAPPDDHRLASLLTARELEVTRLLAGGASNGDIANRLTISEGTVKSHVKHILRKLRASNRAEAASKYVRLLGTAPPPDDD